MSSPACPLTAKPSEQPVAEKHVRFNIENQPPIVVSSKEANRKKSIPQRYILKFPVPLLVYEYTYEELHQITYGTFFLCKQKFTNPEIFKAIAQLYEKAFWRNELHYVAYKLFCYKFMKVKDEKLIQQIIEANYENFINVTIGWASRAEIEPIVYMYNEVGNHHLYELWKRIYDTIERRRNRGRR